MDENTPTAERDEVTEQSDEEIRVAGWRFEQFSQLGFDFVQVAQLATSAVDLDLARRLIRGGCAPPLAASILL